MRGGPLGRPTWQNVVLRLLLGGYVCPPPPRGVGGGGGGGGGGAKPPGGAPPPPPPRPDNSYFPLPSATLSSIYTSSYLSGVSQRRPVGAAGGAAADTAGGGRSASGALPLMVDVVCKARICKRLQSPGIESKQSIPPTYVTLRAGTPNKVDVPVRQAGNRFLDSLKGLQIRAPIIQYPRALFIHLI